MTDISTRSEYVVNVHVCVLRNNRKTQISLVVFRNQHLAVASRINNQDDHTKYMFSIIAIVMWLCSKMSTYPELGQILNLQNKLYMYIQFMFMSKTAFTWTDLHM